MELNALSWLSLRISKDASCCALVPEILVADVTLDAELYWLSATYIEDEASVLSLEFLDNLGRLSNDTL
jgi:hypothetical protein